jgi:hypothetical protein
MWNFDYRYLGDDVKSKLLNFEKRLGASTNMSVVQGYQISYLGRIFDDPKPLYETKNDLRYVQMLQVTHPPVQKNTITLLIRYADQTKPDDTYIYLPSMRRVLRGEAGQRSTPINSSVNAPDDFNTFAGRIPEFTYTLVGEQKIVALANAQETYSSMKDAKTASGNMPVETENWMVKDVYVIDIVPKDDKYPQGKKRVYMDKEHLMIYYSASWDRAGALWKVWCSSVTPHKMTSGGTMPYLMGILSLDIQLGYGNNMFSDWLINGNGYTEADASTSAMRRLAR